MRRITYLAALLLLLTGCISGGLTPTSPPSSPTAGEEEPTAHPPSPTATADQEQVPPTPTAIPTTVAPTSPPPTLTPTPRGTAVGTPLPNLIPGRELRVTYVQMTGQNRGWAIGTQDGRGEYVLATTDGGTTWADVSPPVVQAEDATRLEAFGAFQDSDTAWVIYTDDGPPPVGPLAVWKTTDGGQNWQPSQYLPLTGEEPYFQPEGFSFVDSSTGWLLAHVEAGAGHDFVELFRTEDGGQSWERIDDPFRGQLSGSTNTGIAFGSDQWGWVTKDNPQLIPGGAFLFQSLDGGENWEAIFLPPPQDLDWEEILVKCKTHQPAFTSPQTGLVAVECLDPDRSSSAGNQKLTYVFATSDRGENWQYTELSSVISDLEFADLQTGYAAGRDIFRTEDGGETWQKVKTVTWQGQLSFVNPTLGWAVARKGDDLALVTTRNGAETWQLLDTLAARGQ